MIPFPTVSRRVRELLGGRCDSTTLDLQKFPDIDRLKKSDGLRDFCQRAKINRQYQPSQFSLPEIPGAVAFVAKNRGKLLVDHTGGIVENSNLSMHRLFSFPVIPGSALKGIARAAAHLACLENPELDGIFSRVFGDCEKGQSDTAGSISFLPAYPVNQEWEFVVDVLTSHGGCDTKNPIPVFFPAVKEGVTFRFVVVPTVRAIAGDLEFAVKFLKTGLCENGVGAKTAAGYGWFEIEGETK